jgi:hypothetical protein
MDVQLADELATGLRSATSSRESFLRAIGEDRLAQKKERGIRVNREESEFVKKTRERHEGDVKIKLRSIMSKSRLKLPAPESIFGKRKEKKDESDRSRAGKDGKRKGLDGQERDG